MNQLAQCARYVYSGMRVNSLRWTDITQCILRWTFQLKFLIFYIKLERRNIISIEMLNILHNFGEEIIRTLIHSLISSWNMCFQILKGSNILTFPPKCMTTAMLAIGLWPTKRSAGGALLWVQSSGLLVYFEYFVGKIYACPFVSLSLPHPYLLKIDCISLNIFINTMLLQDIPYVYFMIY
jgi:hypothetical protein